MADWGGGMSAGCSCSLTRAMDGRIVRCGSHCRFRDCKALLVVSLTHVRGAVASTRPLPLSLQQIHDELYTQLHNIVTCQDVVQRVV